MIERKTRSSEFFITSEKRPVRSLQYKAKFTAPKIMKTMHVHSMAGLPNAPILSLRVEKPPVATVENAWQSASMESIPRFHRISPCVRVKPRYRNQRIFAVVAIEAVNLSLSGPDASALMSRKPPAPSMGIIATPSATMPMPPSQWVVQRHTFTLRGSASTFASTVAPVAVKPLTLSKSASLRELNAPLK